MSSAILNITFDCRDARAVAEFWSAVTGYTAHQEGPSENRYWVVTPADGSWPRLVFVPVPEEKSIKNRLHLDVVPTDRTQQQEVDRLLRLGATIVDDRGRGEGGGWVVLSDPEGNEFCVELSTAELRART
jgi:predicted enzyme related to lactoylglutathione lyase